MKNIVEDLIQIMYDCEDENARECLVNSIKDLIYELSDTINCPSNWRYIGEELAKKYKNSEEDSDRFIYNELDFWEYED